MDCSTWNSNLLVHFVCVYIYSPIYMHRYNVSPRATLTFALACIWETQATFWFLLEDGMLCCSRCLLFSFCFLSFFPDWTSVQRANVEYCLMFDNQFLFSILLLLTVFILFTELQYNLNNWFVFCFSLGFLRYLEVWWAWLWRDKGKNADCSLIHRMGSSWLEQTMQYLI